MPDTLSQDDWRVLLTRIDGGLCTPFLGAGACHGVIPLGSQIARDWADEHGYPLQDAPTDLVRVAQYLAVRFDAMFPKDEILKRLKNVAAPDFDDDCEPHRVLAELPLPIYITTNYDSFMVQALKKTGKKPRRELCRWNKRIKARLRKKPSVFELETAPEIDEDNPVVFHLHGHTGVRESLVVTEDDYLDFLVSISREPDLIPPRIEEAFTGTSLLFLGYRLADWDFRVLFRSLVGYLERSLASAHVSVQLLPVGDAISQAEKDKIQEHFDQYFRRIDVRVYWGTCREFVSDLKKRWEEFKDG